MKQLSYQLTPAQPTTTQEETTFKSKLIPILMAGGMEALRVTISHPLVDIAIEIIKKFLEIK